MICAFIYLQVPGLHLPSVGDGVSIAWFQLIVIRDEDKFVYPEQGDRFIIIVDGPTEVS
jgi:hypothetical protein